MGPPGSGKTTMVVKTALKYPVHVVDIDRKMNQMVEFKPLIDTGKVTYWELSETINEDKLAGRLTSLLAEKDKQRANQAPLGWTKICRYTDTWEKDPLLQKAGTVLWDSYTISAVHLKAHMQFISGKSKLVWEAWSAWDQMWQETTNILIDYVNSTATDGCNIIKDGELKGLCEHRNPPKDLVLTIHERVSEKPGDKTKTVIIKHDEKGQRQKDYIGQMDVKIAGSIDGAFGLKFGAWFTDVYALRVDVDKKTGIPKWICRVHPDSQRDLRCSAKQQFDANHNLVSEFEPDYAKIFGIKKGGIVASPLR